MKQEDIRYTYEIDSTLDLDLIIDSLKQELKSKEGMIKYFSLEEDELIEEKLPLDKLKKVALEISSNDENPSLIFPDVEVIVDNDNGKIEVISKKKLVLQGVDIEEIIEK